MGVIHCSSCVSLLSLHFPSHFLLLFSLCSTFSFILLLLLRVVLLSFVFHCLFLMPQLCAAMQGECGHSMHSCCWSCSQQHLELALSSHLSICRAPWFSVYKTVGRSLSFSDSRDRETKGRESVFAEVETIFFRISHPFFNLFFHVFLLSPSSKPVLFLICSSLFFLFRVFVISSSSQCVCNSSCISQSWKRTGHPFANSFFCFVVVLLGRI